MTVTALTGPAARIAAAGTITPDDVLALRRGIFADGIVDAKEAETLVALDAAVARRCAQWRAFFVEALADYTVHQAAPHGFVSPQNAAWLTAAIADDGLVRTDTELEALIAIVEKARSVPDTLVAFALEQVRRAVVCGEGPLASGARLEPGVVGEAEVALLRRILYAHGGDGSIAVTRAEAQVLFAINDETAEAKNHPAWSELFVKAIGSHLMAALGHVPPSRSEALDRERWFDDAHTDARGFLARLVEGFGAAWTDGPLFARTLRGDIEAAHAAERLARAEEARRAAAIDASEAAWVVERIGRDGRLHANERLLLDLLRAESAALPPALDALMARVA